MDNKVMLFIRPQESPVFTDDDKNVRIAYGDKWIDFKEGKIIVWDDKTGQFLEYRDLYVDGDDRRGK